MSKRRKMSIFILVTLVLVSNCLSLNSVSAAAPGSPTESFIIGKLYNPNQTIATRLTDGSSSLDPNMAGGREALSESLALWMTYAVRKNDKSLYKTSYDLLNKYFLAPEGTVYWKLNQDGSSQVSTNAMIDDHLIIEALYKGYSQWNVPAYKQTADKLSNASKTKNIVNGYFVDYYDFNSGYQPNQLTLSYIVPGALTQMLNNQQIDNAIWSRQIDLLNTLPMDNSFFPKTYDVVTNQFTYDSTINMIDQVYIALHRAEAGTSSPALYNLIKTDFYKSNRLISSYDRITKAPVSDLECPAQYGLTILYALQVNDKSFALDLYKRMIALRVSDKSSPYYGGYVFNNDTFSFNNLYALLAEQKLNTMGLIR